MQQISDFGQLAATHRAYGRALMALHRPADATTCFTAALALYEHGGREHEVALPLIELGEALTACGREPEALPRLRQARQLLSAEPDAFHQARAQAALGMASAHHPQLATAYLQRAQSTMRDLGCPPEQAAIAQALGDLAARNGQAAQARCHYQEAVAILPGTNPVGQQIRGMLEALDGPQLDPHV